MPMADNAPGAGCWLSTRGCGMLVERQPHEQLITRSQHIAAKSVLVVNTQRAGIMRLLSCCWYMQSFAGAATPLTFLGRD
jgi:hypothetical protein